MGSTRHATVSTSPSCGAVNGMNSSGRNMAGLGSAGSNDQAMVPLIKICELRMGSPAMAGEVWGHESCHGGASSLSQLLLALVPAYPVVATVLSRRRKPLPRAVLAWGFFFFSYPA
jgi:hypothetical protein